jgi:BMFP domain-containing protein YqiC
MAQDNKLFQDLGKLASSAMSTAANAKNELTSFVKLQIEMFMKSMNFVTKEEFEVVKKLAEKNSMDLKKILSEKEPIKAKTKPHSIGRKVAVAKSQSVKEKE